MICMLYRLIQAAVLAIDVPLPSARDQGNPHQNNWQSGKHHEGQLPVRTEREAEGRQSLDKRQNRKT